MARVPHFICLSANGDLSSTRAWLRAALDHTDPRLTLSIFCRYLAYGPSRTIIFSSIAHCFSPPGIDTTLLHVLSKPFHSVYLVQPSACFYVRVGVYNVISSDAGRAGSKLIVFIFQSLPPAVSLLLPSHGRLYLQQLLTWTTLTHCSTPRSEPSTYMMPGGPPLRINTKTSWLDAACLSFATFFRDVM